jgi:serine protease AprX
MRDSLNQIAILLTVVMSLGLFSLSIQAKSLDPLLKKAILNQQPNYLHQVIVAFKSRGAPSDSQISALDRIGVTGISLKQLPIAGLLATSHQIEAIYQRADVVSVWLNSELSYDNQALDKLTGIESLKNDNSLRLNGLPFSGKGIGVVVNDSGVDGMHGDIKYPNHTVQNVSAQTNLNSFSGVLPISYQENVSNTDIAGGHGSHVAGVIAANGAMSNGDHTGVAPNANIIGYGSGAGLFILDALGGFDYALTHQYNYNIRVVSNAFGSKSDVGTSFNPEHPINIATKKLVERGVMVVFSVGNSGDGEGTITGNFKKAPWVIAVAAADQKGKLTQFSSRGEKGRTGTVSVDDQVYHWLDEPTITAPGVDIISIRASLSSLSALSIADDSEVIKPKHLPYYTLMSGTSMAAAHVSGVIALMLEANPNLNWRDVKSIIQHSATQMPERASWERGAGFINAYEAVKAARAGVCC